MHTGDVLYVPAGCRHSARTVGAPSLHLTIGILRVTYRHVVERLLREHVGELDAPLPIGYRGGADAGPTGRRLADGLRDALATAAARLQQIDPADVVASEQRRKNGAYARAGHVASVVRRDTIGTDSVISWVTGAARLEALPDDRDGRAWVRLHLTNGALRMPATARTAVAWLADQGSARVGDLPSLDAPSQCSLARRLVDEHVCILLP
jgi:hypothetical protein